MKKRIYTTKGYMSMFILEGIAVIIAEVIFLYASFQTQPTVSNIISCILMDLIGAIGIGLVLFYIITFFQWVDLDEKGICAHNLVKKMHYKEWSQIKEIREEYLPLSVRGGFILKYFILIDDRDDLFIRNGVMRKNSYILIPSNQKTEAMIREFYKGEIIRIEEK